MGRGLKHRGGERPSFERAWLFAWNVYVGDGVGLQTIVGFWMLMGLIVVAIAALFAPIWVPIVIWEVVT